MTNFLDSRQIFACFSVPMYDPLLDKLVEVLANDNDMYGEEWFYTGIQRKIDDIQA